MTRLTAEFKDRNRYKKEAFRIKMRMKKYYKKHPEERPNSYDFSCTNFSGNYNGSQTNNIKD
jgi:hypothetical protein